MTQNDITLPTPEPLRFCTWNLENFYGLSGEQSHKLHGIAHTIANKLDNPHVIALQEIMDDSGERDDDTVSAQENMTTLIAAIKKSGGKDYTYIEIPPENNQDGGQPGANIRNGFLYRTDRLKLATPTEQRTHDIQRAALSRDLQTSYLHLRHFNPALIEPRSTAFSGSRKPLVAQFIDRRTGEHYFTVNLHLASNGMPPPPQEGQPRGEWQPNAQRMSKREHQLKSVASFCNTLLNRIAARGFQETHHVVVMGDFNAASALKIGDKPEVDLSNDPIFYALERIGLIKADKRLPRGSYSQAFEVNNAPKQMWLDHIYVSAPLYRRMQTIERPTAVPEPRQDRISDHTPTTATFTAMLSQRARGQLGR